MRGFLIAVEGIDGAGKTTQARMLVRWLAERGLKAHYTREPTDGPVGRILREMALRRDVEPRVEALLFAADRLHHVREVINPLISKGYIVVSDRYIHSSLAYQSETTGQPEWVREINRFAPPPDLAILLDVEPSVGLSRIRGERSRFEDPVLLGRIRRNYLEMAERGEMRVVDAGEEVEKVSEKIRRIVSEFLNL